MELFITSSNIAGRSGHHGGVFLVTNADFDFTMGTPSDHIIFGLNSF